MMHRKNFIKLSCKACVGIAIGGSIFNLLSSCSPLPIYRTGANNRLIEVDLSNFQLEKNMLVVKCKGMDFDILLIKKTDNNYTALYMMCTHERQPLSATNKGLHCSSHGSAFDLDGNVTIQPATKNLIKYKTSLQDQKVIINLNKII